MEDQGIPTIDEVLKYSTEAIERGDAHVGRRALLWIITEDPSNVTAWLLLADLLEDPKAKIDCYSRVLRSDPENECALKGLEALGQGAITDQLISPDGSALEGAASAIPELGYVGAILATEDKVKAKLDIARRELLDLSLFNKLLNYRPLKTKGTEIIDESPVEVYRILVSEGRSMSFLPIPEEEQEDQAPLFQEDRNSSDEALGQPEEDEKAVAPRHTDNRLQTPYSSQVLQKRLLNTYYAARTYIEEQGVNILFLALCMLEWYESRSSDTPRRAPLILVPVELSRSNVRSRFRVKYTQDDIGENLSLRAKLQSDFGIRLPDFPEDEDIDVDSYLRKVSQVIRNHPRWKVDSEAVALGFFSFGKFLMFNDLDSENWPEELAPETHPILRAVLHDGFKVADLALDYDDEIDECVSPEETHHVVDADSSQAMAILEVSNGRDLVIQGPPGTGKSQTITNLVAEAVGHGKTVLFVSQKMAALEVVKRRLDQVGLGDACLELHSQKTKKRLVLDELRRCMDLGQPRLDQPVDTNELVRNRERLNAYSKAVNSEIGESGLTPYQVYGRLLRIRESLSGKELPELEITGADRWTREEANRNLSLTEDLQLLIQRIGRPVDHPFWGSRIPILLPANKDHIQHRLSIARQSLDDLMSRSAEVSGLMRLPRTASRDEVKAIGRTAAFILTAPILEGVKVASEVWMTQSGRLEEVLKAGQTIKQLYDVHDEMLKDESWDEDVLELCELMTRYKARWWRRLSRGYREARRTLAGLCKKDLPKSLDRQIELLHAILEVQKLGPVLEGFDEEGREIFGDRWRGVESNWKELTEISSWLGKLHEGTMTDELPTQIVGFVATLPDLSILERKTHQLSTRRTEHEAAIREVVEALELDESTRFGEDNTLVNLPFDVQDHQFRSWQNELDRLQEIVTLRDQLDQLRKAGLESIAETSLSWHHGNQHLVDLLEYRWLSSLLARAMMERPILASFDGRIHEHSIERFCELDTKLFNHNRICLAYEHWATLPRHQAGGQLGVLQREFAKRRRHKPIRRLLAEAGNVIQVVKPVFMMSPLSIAMFLPPGTIDFDVVIFDEASQVKPVDAFGAILRGKQLVVAGDDRQLPPTTFFESAIDVDEDYSESVTADLESILGLCLAQGIPHRTLRWHYRSQHESLIAVSNYEFYGDKLVVFPSPDKDRREVGLFYHHLPNTEYGRGRSRTNPGEARRVAEAVMHHARSFPDLTLGVAALSISQMRAIHDQLEILRRQDPSNEEYFRSHPEEPFFIKNLETVQGDERDVIFISVGYGRTAEGRVSMNFGPINHKGGERRLNVLITRARKRCEVFTNLKANDIDLSRTRARGVEVLKRFLEYAASGHLDIPIPSGREFDSPFEEAVAHKLTQSGYRVEHQVGTGGFFIDLAIIDEERPGRYLLGIECDGAMYHSARSARDRDRLRQEVLESLGWKLHRIWSTDWFRNPEREIRRLVKSIEEAKTQDTAEEPPKRGSKHTHILEASAIERHEPSKKEKATIHIELYETASLGILHQRETLHEVSRHRMASWIKAVVDVESPVHQDEIARRIANCAGVKRIGGRIRAAFYSGLATAVRDRLVRQQGEFLWRPDMKQPKLRSRSGIPLASRSIHLISPEELAVAILGVIKASYGIQREMIPAEVCRLFGFRRTTSDISVTVDHIVGKLLDEGRVIDSGRYVDLPSG